MSENLESNGVRVTPEWLTPENQTSYNYSYNITVIPQIAFMITERTRIKLKVSYNTTYNVSILTTPQCGVAPSIELYYDEKKN